MPSAASLAPDSRFVGLFVGPSGSGKTPAACSFITPDAIKQGRRVKVFDFDGRIRGLLGCPWVNRNCVDYEYYPPRMKGGVYNKLNEDLEALQTQCVLGSNVYDTVVIDSLTTQTFAFLCDSIPITHQNNKGRKIGALMVEGPDDYRFESSGTYSMLAFFRSLPVQNVIFTAHIIDRYGKLDPNDMMSPQIVVGDKLSIRDKLAANIPGTFDHVVKFDRRMVGNEVRYFVRFWSDLARSVYPGLPTGDQDVTGKNFYEYLMSLVRPASSIQAVS